MARRLRDCDGRVCKIPGCGRLIYRGNESGVCQGHNHVRPYCGCIQCTGAPPPPPPIKDRQGLVTREIPYPSTNSSAPLRMPVTMKAFPWEKV